MADRFKDHSFETPSPRAKTSPCPALNALRNYGFIHRDGKQIHLSSLVKALQDVYNLSEELAYFLAVPGILLCGHIVGLYVDLDKLARVNRIEHRFSLVHADAGEGQAYAPVEVDEERYNQLMTINGTEEEQPYLSMEDFIRHRNNLMGKENLDKIHATVASGEIIMIMWMFGKDITVKGKHGTDKKKKLVLKAAMRAWLHDGKFPEGWETPEKQLTLGELNGSQKEYKKVVDELLAAAHNERGTLEQKEAEKLKGKLEDLVKGDIEQPVGRCPFHASVSKHH
ncbi:Cloroperoxidase [Fomitiporia mediterranea MF3/22]|uniref:Cloroperoxidase n=1 Tax=Fomitiporia mediterranea (strain MF3/22) TaxID=694068 RepID=UPI00044086ED|nr:Cloroperoxidase [Fomitiporia mediterranea MF3/22]EJD06094.1 Cloroperoxidase [Fomitiporia mediterranea MF3/22]